jgi:hypothetical protein
MKTALFLLVVFLLSGSCATVPEEPEFNYSPPMEMWLVYFEPGRLSGEEFLCLIKGSFAVKEMEAMKITASRRGNDGGMSVLARKTRMKVDESISGEK